VRNVIGLVGCSTGRALFQRALAGGARAMGLPAAGIVPGAAADLVSLDVRRPALVCRTDDALLDSWIFASPRGAVDCVWVHGRKLVAEGRHVRGDAIRRKFDTTMEQLCG
jgi:cytosine/adenosine deaminase-related metal-dependent hydrolase